MWFSAFSTSVLIGTFEAYAWKFEVYVSFRDCERRGDVDVWRKMQVSKAHFNLFFFFYTTIHCDYISECQTAFVWSVDLQECLCLSVSVFCSQPWRRWVRCLLLLNLSHTFFKNLFLFTVHSWVESLRLLVRMLVFWSLFGQLLTAELRLYGQYLMIIICSMIWDVPKSILSFNWRRRSDELFNTQHWVQMI